MERNDRTDRRVVSPDGWRRLAQIVEDGDVPSFDEWWQETFGSPLPDRTEPGRDD